MDAFPQMHPIAGVIVSMRLMSVVPALLGRGSFGYNRSLTVAAPFRGGAATVRERLHRGPRLAIRSTSQENVSD